MEAATLLRRLADDAAFRADFVATLSSDGRLADANVLRECADALERNPGRAATAAMWFRND